jgi:FMN phosphatase YigB (HAD superfamily)
LDGTLYRPLPVKLAMAAELALLGPGALKRVRAFRDEHEALRAELVEPVESPFHLQLERASRRLGRSTRELELAVRTWMQERPGRWIRRFRRAALLAEIDAFRAEGGRTALVSDYPALSKLRALGAEHLFDAVVASGEPGGPGRLKPWPDGYLLAARALDVEPGKCLVVGDRDDADGEAARRAGMAFRLVR